MVLVPLVWIIKALALDAKYVWPAGIATTHLLLEITRLIHYVTTGSSNTTIGEIVVPN